MRIRISGLIKSNCNGNEIVDMVDLKVPRGIKISLNLFLRSNIEMLLLKMFLSSSLYSMFSVGMSLRYSSFGWTSDYKTAVRGR